MKVSNNVSKGPFSTIAQIRAANKAFGSNFFSRSTMKFFHSRIESSVYAGRYFITSEHFYGSLGTGRRRYTIRYAKDTGEINTAGKNGFDVFSYLEDARVFLRAFIGGADGPIGPEDSPIVQLWNSMKEEIQ